MPLDLADQFFQIRARGKCNSAKSPRQRFDDGKALATNRAGRTQYRELFHEVLFPFCTLWRRPESTSAVSKTKSNSTRQPESSISTRQSGRASRRDPAKSFPNPLRLRCA